MAPPLQQFTRWFCALPQGQKQVLTESLCPVFVELNEVPPACKEQTLLRILVNQPANVSLIALVLNLRTHIEYTMTLQADALPRLANAGDLLFYSRAQDGDSLRKIADEQWQWQQSRESWLELKRNYLSLEYVRRWLQAS
ncbi:hypothetical protein [Pseudoalteromonas rubra]|uniref:Uncharacterized protein n=1 Tax=Pseudoalteromonas rubra TaxID=43658 RepID=A0A0U3HSM7_9GAMM|nr:hypothetical protein [Pseudoalteromonas rubra]ALU45941.1 hypothetical protein AT705_23745 [Pseudoalteromonas rubra]